MRRLVAVGLVLLAAWACTEDVQLVRARRTPSTAPPAVSDDDRDPAERARDAYCAGRGPALPEALLDPSGDASGCSEPAPRLLQHALCACADAVLTGGLATDAFDSAQAPYVPGHGGANVATNGQLVATGAVDVHGDVISAGPGPLPITITPFELAGSLKTGGDLSIAAAGTRIGGDLWVLGEIVAVAGDATVGGDVYQPPGRTGASALSIGGQLHTRELAIDPPCPCADEQLLDVGAIVAYGREHNDNGARALPPDALYRTASAGPLELACGRYAFDGGAILDQARIVAHGRTTLFIHGDLAITGGFAPELTGGEMDVFIDGNLALAPGAVLGSSDRPAALRLYVGGAGDLVLTGAATLAAALYAPSTTLYLTNEQSSYGALLLAGFIASAAQSIHYDAAVLRAADGALAEACKAPK